MTEQKKICLVIPSLHAGGMERVMSELANYFAQKPGLEIHLVCLIKGKIFYSIAESVILHEPDFEKKSWFIYSLMTLIYLRKTLKKINPVAVLSFGETYNSFVLLSALFLNLKIFVSDRSKPDKSWGKTHEFLRRILYPKAKGIISQTTYSKTFLQKETNHTNICVIPNPVDAAKFNGQQRRKVILNVGRLISSKKIEILLEIFAQTNHGDWNLWIVGDGPLRFQLEEKAAQLGISNAVKFWGSQKDIAGYYSQSAIFAFTSVSEGFPNALLEALAAGLPCISFDCVAGPSDLIQDGVNGFLIPEMDTETYLSKLQHLMDNVELRNNMGNQALETAKEFHISKIGEDYLKFITA